MMNKHLKKLVLSSLLIVGSLVGIGLTLGWLTTLFLFLLMWGNNLEQNRK